MMMILLSLLILQLMLSLCYSFHVNTNINRYLKSSSLSMKIDAMRDVFGLVPLCDAAAANPFTSAPPSISIIDDPTAGMTPEEITNYVSNVGGNLCGLPDIVRSSIGLGLNLSLLSFGILTLLYVLIGGSNFVLENQLKDAIKDYEKESGSKLWSILNAESAKPTTSPEKYVPSQEALALAPNKFNSKDTVSSSSNSMINSQGESSGLNRKEKRIKQQLSKDVEKEKNKRNSL